MKYILTILLSLITVMSVNARPPEKEMVEKSFTTADKYENTLEDIKEVEFGEIESYDDLERVKRDADDYDDETEENIPSSGTIVQLKKTDDINTLIHNNSELIFGTGHKVTKRGIKDFINKFLYGEKNSQNNNNNKSGSGNHKYYSCKISNKNKSEYDVMYYEFAKNVQRNNYDLVNTKVIHGYYSDIQVKNDDKIPTNNNIGNRNSVQNNNKNISPVGYNNNNNLNSFSTVTKPTGVPKTVTNDEFITKKNMNVNECVIGATKCPIGMIRRGNICIPAPNELSEVDYLDEEYGFDYNG